jgi:hypothetical protein
MGHRIAPDGMNAEILEFLLDRSEALDHRKFDSNLIPGNQALDNVSSAPQRKMAARQYLRHRYCPQEPRFSPKNITCG